MAATYYRVDDGPAVAYPGGVVPVYAARGTSVSYWSVDAAGNQESPRTALVLIDDGRPYTSAAGVPGGWTSAPPVISLGARTARGAIAATRYRLGAGIDTEYAGPFTVSDEGTTVVRYGSLDSLGNAEESRTATVLLDRTAPAAGASGVPSAWSPTPVQLSITATDGGSGVDAVWCGPADQPAYRYGATVRRSISEDGEQQLTWWAVDRVGNATAPRTVTVRVDRTAPVSAISSVPSGASAGPVTLDVTAHDALSGVAHTWCRIDSGPAVETAGVRVSAPGPHTVWFRSSDAAGNEEEWRSASFTIAAEAEAVTTTHTIVPAVPTGWSGWYSTTPTVSVIRDGSGLTWFGEGPHRNWQMSTEAVFVPQLTEGERPYSYFGVDSAGVTETVVHFFVLKLDTRPPVTLDDVVPSYEGSATIHLTPTDPALGSGVQATFWALDGLPGGGTLVRTSFEGTHTLEYSSADAAGNFELTKSVTFFVGAPGEPPVAPSTTHSVVPAAPNGAGGWYVTTPTVTVLRDGTGTTYFGEGAHPVWQTSTIGLFVPVLSEGDRAYSYFAVGPTGATETPAHLFGLKLDTRTPGVTDDASAIYQGRATVHLAAEDPAPGSGVAAIEWLLDGHAGSGSLVSTTVPGAHVLDYWARDVAGNAGAPRRVSFEVTTAPIAETTRVPGVDRYEVSARLAALSYPDLSAVHHVIVACGSDRAMADPLSAAGLAGAYRAPLLLVQTDSRVVVPSATLSMLQAMRSAGGPLAIHVVGGPASVTAGHVRVLARYGSVDRIGGADRYAVAAGVAARMRSVLGASAPKTALLANGNMAFYHWNALAASPVAAAAHYPILLVKNGSVPPATLAALKGYSTRWVVGDGGAVNATAYQLAGGTGRVGGADRFAVAASVAEQFCGSGELRWENVGVASRLSDALTGGTLLGSLGGPLLLTDPTTLPAATSGALSAHASEISQLTILGGTASVTPSVELELRAALGL